MATPRPPDSARRYYAVSALIATRAASEALAARSRGIHAAWLAVIRAQIQQATLAPHAIDAMLREQQITVQADALLNSSAFITSAARFEAMASQVKVDAEFERLVASITQDAGRAAQQVAVVARPHVEYVRHLNLPSCSRCAVLAGRVYRYSTGFPRHPGCDCVMIPVTVASPDLTYDPVQLAREGQIGSHRTLKDGTRRFEPSLSKADMKALEGGASFNKLVNTKQRSAGLLRPGDVIGQGPAIEDLIAAANSRGAALNALTAYVN